MLLTMKLGPRWARACLSAALAAALAAPGLAESQTSRASPTESATPEPSTPAAAPAAPEPSTPAAAPPEQAEPAPDASRFTSEELQKLLAPIALYPDPLLAQLLPASAYPLQIVQAYRWLEANKAQVKKKDFSGVDKQKWDPTVKALARFPPSSGR